MGVKSRNIKNLLKDARSRTILVITFSVLIIAVLAGYFVFRDVVQGPKASADIEGAPGIASVPTGAKASPEYARLLTEANIQRAQEAQKTGSSAIPTIIRAVNPADAKIVEGAKNQPWDAGLGFKQLAEAQDQGTPKAFAIDAVQQTGCDKKDLEEAIKDGATLAELKGAGCTVEDLEKAGFTPEALQKAGFSACDLMGATGVNPKAMKDAGYTAGELRGVGYNACQLKNAGFTLPELINAGFTPAELRGVGFNPSNIAAAEAAIPSQAGAETGTGTTPIPGLPPGVTASALRAAGCGVAAIEKDKAEGVSAAAIRAIGCTASQLRTGGYDAAELRNAGYTAGELKNAGFTAQQLKNAGFSARDLRDAGYTPSELKNAGFSDAQLKNAGFSGVTPIGNLCSKAAIEKDAKDGVSAATIKSRGCTAGQLRAAGFTAGQLRNAGFSAKALHNAGYTANQLKDAGYTANQLKNAGYTAGQLANAGYTAQQLKNAGFNAAQLKSAGFNAQQLKNAGFSAGQLKNAGFSANQLKNAGFSANNLKNAGYSPQQLKDAGYTAKQLKDAGLSANQLRNAGYSGSDLQDAGYAPAQLTDAGISIPSGGFQQQQDQQQQQPDQSTVVSEPLQPTNVQSAEAQQQQMMQQQQLQQEKQQLTAVMTSQVGQLLSAWTAPAQQTLVEGIPPKQKSGAAGQGGAGGAGGVNKAPPIIKAGKIMFAVLTTSVDSDYPGPVLATIVSGKYKGAKLIGTLTTFPGQNKKVMLTFDTMNVAKYSTTFSISAVAISPKTARTALSDYTNNHYLLRFGTLFAASFLEGYGQAFLQSGQTINSSPASTTITSPELSPDGKLFVALGNVGNKFGSVLEPIFNKPPTVYVYSGTGLGILFLKDVAAPTPATA